MTCVRTIARVSGISSDGTAAGRGRESFRDVPAEPGQNVVIDIGGVSGGEWTLPREEARGMLWRGEPPFGNGAHTVER